MSFYNIVASSKEATVVAEYTPEPYRAVDYQSEAAMEADLLQRLQAQGYEYVSIRDEAALIANLRKQLELLNQITFSDAEWQRFFNQNIASANEGIVEKTRKIQTDYVQVLRRDDGSSKNISLIDKKAIHNNRLQVLNQYEEPEGTYKSRYDVTILVNGLPMVHIELKRRGVALREAFNQIDRYQRDSFWASSGLYEYVQIFVISNGTHTRYYSNTTRMQHIHQIAGSARGRNNKASHSFQFACYWADASNRIIMELVDFTQTFLSKHTLLNVLTRYCVFTADDLLLVMRPYQIAATERILNRILLSSNYKKTGSLEAGGYIWHTTGSGKTLTSFKTAQLATSLPGIEKVIFVVDRKDLDYQTMREYDKFERGAANCNRSTRVMQKQLEDPNVKIIITTIQKLERFISANKTHPIYKQHVVLIFDECHRSQFGYMHQQITKAFKNYHIFGFTGTPIFAANAGNNTNPLLRTTEQAFGDKLHTYTIVDAINDGNVLPFRIDYISTMHMAPDVVDKQVAAIDQERALRAPERIREVTNYILTHFDQKTMRNSAYTLKGQRVMGFNSIFAVSSIDTAKLYYQEFKRQLLERHSKLVVATIFSYSPNEENPEDVFPDESLETEGLTKTDRDFLESAIQDYNETFGTAFDTSAERFENYYKDVSNRVKNREVDLLIVVNMFLTGFDATTLNTLWVDKNLRQHGLLQAFSRTNRILNSVKTFGNIVCFRNLKEATDEAIALFGDKEAGGIVLLKTYEEYYNGYEDGGKHQKGYCELIETLQKEFPLGQPITGEEAQKDFIRLYGAILRMRNILNAFDEFAGNEILPPRALQDYQSVYIDLYQEIKPRLEVEKENVNSDIVFELELIKQIEVNIDYILMLVAKYHASNCSDRSILESIDRAINSSIELRSKKELIQGFISRVNDQTDVEADWQSFVRAQKEKDMSDIITEENLRKEPARMFMEGSLRSGVLKTTGTEFDRILPAISRFSGGDRAKKRQSVITRLVKFFEKYLGL